MSAKANVDCASRVDSMRPANLNVVALWFVATLAKNHAQRVVRPAKENVKIVVFTVNVRESVVSHVNHAKSLVSGDVNTISVPCSALNHVIGPRVISHVGN